MFILVTVHAQVFPVGAVSGIVPAVPVFMVHGQQVTGFVVELSTTLGAYESVNIQRAFPVSAGRRNVLPQFPDNLFNGFAFASFFGQRDLRLPLYVLLIIRIPPMEKRLK